MEKEEYSVFYKIVSIISRIADALEKRNRLMSKKVSRPNNFSDVTKDPSTNDSHRSHLKIDGDIYQLNGQIIQSTEKGLAILPVDFIKEIWFPRYRENGNKQVVSDFIEQKNLVQWFTIEKWALQQRGLLEE